MLQWSSEMVRARLTPASGGLQRERRDPHTPAHTHTLLLPRSHNTCHTNRNSPTHTDTLTHPYTVTHSQSPHHTHTETHPHTQTHSPTYSLTHSHSPHRTHTHTQVYSHTATYTHRRTHSPTVSHTHTQSHTLTHTDTPSLTPSTHTQAHIHWAAHAHAHTQTPTLMLTHTHTQRPGPWGWRAEPGRLVSLSGLFPGSGSGPDAWAVPCSQWAPGGAGEGTGPLLVGDWLGWRRRGCPSPSGGGGLGQRPCAGLGVLLLLCPY